MTTHTVVDSRALDYLKGAPEIVLGMCDASDQQRTRVLGTIDQWAGEGLRLLGLAYREHQNLDNHTGYRWLGLVAMEDPIREGVVDAVRVAQRAGIQVKMITGDYRRTADRIGRMIGLVREGDLVLEGAELGTMDDAGLASKVQQTAVFSRIKPQDKLRIVRALQSTNQVTAMIGDGVNDAPALKRANIGVVVGTATDVAKESADLILLDSNFRTVVAAVEEGRTIFENIRKVVAYTLSNSFAEVITIFTAMILGWPTPLTVAQILWIHLICDGPSDIVLGFEPKEDGIMDEKPKSVHEPILTRLSASLIGFISISSAVFALSLFRHFWAVHGNATEGRSVVFASFAINSMIYIFAYRSLRRTMLRTAPLSVNKPLVFAVLGGLLTALLPFFVPSLQRLLGIVPLTVEDWALVGGVATALLMAVEIAKIISLRIHRQK